MSPAGSQSIMSTGGRWRCRRSGSRKRRAIAVPPRLVAETESRPRPLVKCSPAAGSAAQDPILQQAPISDDRFTRVGEDMDGTGAHEGAHLQPPVAPVGTPGPTTPKPDKSLPNNSLEC